MSTICTWKNKKRGKGQPDTKTTARIPKDILRLLRECGWDSLTEVLQGKLWGYEKAKEGELFSSYFSVSEFLSVLEKMEWEFYCKYNETLFYMGHDGKKVTGGYYFSVYTEDSEDEDESPQYFKSARELLNSATVEGKSIVSLWDELMVTEE